MSSKFFDFFNIFDLIFFYKISNKSHNENYNKIARFKIITLMRSSTTSTKCFGTQDFTIFFIDLVERKSTQNTRLFRKIKFSNFEVLKF